MVVAPRLIVLLLVAASLSAGGQDTTPAHATPPARTPTSSRIHALNSLPPEPPAEADRDTGVEVRLELIHGAAARDLTLGVSIINHLSRDIYIPCFELFSSYSGIHYYQQDSGKWKEWDLMLHVPWRVWTCITYDNGMIADVMPVLHDDQNEVTLAYRSYVHDLHRRQDSILVAYCGARSRDYHAWTMPGTRPLFLKANQDLRYYLLFDLEYFLGENKDYRITFNTSARDTSFRYFDPTGPLGPWPDRMFTYSRYTPAKIAPSTIYLSTPGSVLSGSR